MTRKSARTLAFLLLLTPLACIEPDAEFPIEALESEPLPVSVAAATIEEPCATEVTTDPDLFWDMTAEEISGAPSGYLMMAPVKSPEEAECNAESVMTVRVAEGVSPDAKITSLCADEHFGGEVVLRECAEHEVSLADMGMSSVTTEQDPRVGCYFCTQDSCINNYTLKQRKEGSTGPCIPNIWNTCCWAFNGGCCS